MAALINGLLFECPFKQELDNCPFIAIRTKKFEEALKAIPSLDGISINQLNTYHRLCAKTRELNFRQLKV